MADQPNWDARLRSALSAADPPVESDIVEELAQHARATYDSAIASGCSPEVAEARAHEHIARWQRDSRTLHRHRAHQPAVVPPPPAPSWWTGVGHDIRYALRLLHRSPRHALIVIATMALGIAATTGLFSVTYGVLMKPLPWTSGDRLVELRETRGGKPPRFGAFSNAAYHAWSGESSVIDGIVAWSQRTVTMFDGTESERILVTTATTNVFSTLDASPLVGALFAANSDPADRVIVLSERLWRRRFGSDPDAIKRSVQLDGASYRIIGVLPDAQAFPNRLALAWIPYRVPPTDNNALSLFSATARLRPGHTAAQAAAEGAARGRFVADTGMTTTAIFGGDGPLEITATPLREAWTASVRTPLIVMLGAVGLLFLTAIANVAALQLARGADRMREFAIRASLGAGVARTLRQLVIEGAVLGLLGGAMGIALAAALQAALPAWLPPDFPRADGLHLEALSLWLAVGLSAITGVVCGLPPALGLLRRDLSARLLMEGRTTAVSGLQRRAPGARLAIVVGQVAIAVVLLVGASLLGRSFFAMVSADRGYDPADVLTARVSFPGGMFGPEQRFEIIRGVLDRAAASPGVIAAAFTSEMPLTPGGSTSSFQLQKPGSADRVSVQASPRIVSRRYFDSLRMRASQGRTFDESDVAGSEPAIIVNQTFARRFLGEAALGTRMPWAVGFTGDNTILGTVVGVVDDIRYLGARDATLAEVYYAFEQLPGRLPIPVPTLMIRTDGRTPLHETVRTIVRDADSRLAPDAVVLFEDRILTTLARPRLYAALLVLFATIALLLTVVGLFGVLSFNVAQRTREIAVRTTLGATPGRLLWMVLRQALAVVAAGLAFGLPLAFWAGRTAASLLYGVAPGDVFTYLAVTAVVVLVATAAAIAPAFRAAHTDPARVLSQ